MTYVWGGTEARGSRFVNPHLGDDGIMIVLRSGRAPTGRWLTEEVDLAADFRMAFGFAAPPPSHIALSADSDDRGGRSRAWVKDIEITGAP